VPSSYTLANIYSALPRKIIGSNRKISAIVYVILVTIVVDTLINQNADYLVEQNSSGPGVALFVMMAAISILGHFFILEYVKLKSKEIRQKVRHLDLLHKIVTIAQYSLISIFIFIIVEIFTTHQYLTITLSVVTASSYGLNIGLMGIFAFIFFSWYRSNKNSVVVLLYGLSFAVVVVTSSVFLASSLLRFVDSPTYRYPDSEVEFTSPEKDSIRYNLGKIYHYSDIVSFMLKWVATAFLLYHYSKKIGKTKYWLLVGIPLIYFLGTFLDDFNVYKPHSQEEWFYWYLYASLNSTAGGILFGIGFMLGAKHFPSTSTIKDYMIISGFGFIFFFSAGQSTLTIAPYPPYGLATMSFFGLSTYLILLGLYASAISVSEDIELRKSIKKSTLREARFLDSMGTAHMEKELMKRMVLKAREEQRIRSQESGIVASLGEEDIINIVKETEKDVRENK
jgi:hypothetical protein